VHATIRGSSVHPVVRVTGNFTSESPLPEVVRSALLAAFDQGWADPKKLSQSSARAAILHNQALENIAAHLKVPTDSLEVIGEPALGHYLAIAGLLREDLTFAYSATDKGKIRAIARTHRGAIAELPVDDRGAINSSQIPKDSVLSLQLANGETGVVQNSEALAGLSKFVAIDATSAGSRIALPDRWDTALFDARSWNGPGGLAILAIKNKNQFAYPLPHIAPIKSPGTFSLPLLIAASVALENFTVEEPTLREFALAALSAIPGVRVIAPQAPSISSVFSIVVDGFNGEHLVRELSARSIDVDSGSACSPADLQPSHVLAAMGYPTDGHLLITLKTGMTREDTAALAKALIEITS
jgi:cysteine desulfurase